MEAKTKTKMQVLLEMHKQAIAISGRNASKWARDAENAIWQMASDWNSDHPDDEIFMCEKYDEEQEKVIGFYIEDDWYITDLEA